MVGDLILLELPQGARDDAHAARIEAALRTFPVVAMLRDAIAVVAAANYRRLRAAGVTASKTADLITATYCIESGAALLHQDRDFAPFVAHCGLRTL